MLIEDLTAKIIKSEKGFFKYIQSILRYFFRINIPAPKIIFLPLYELLVIFRYILPFLANKFVYTPIFKSRCEICGKGLSVVNNIPWVEGNLIIRIGNNVTLDSNIFVSGRRSNVKPVLFIGDGTFIGYHTEISVIKSITIGKNCMIARNCFIADNNGHWINPQKRGNRLPLSVSEAKSITIGDNVWIGTGAVILRGVEIGNGSIVSANSLVTQSIPPNTIVMGIPARKVLEGIDKINI